MSTDKANSSQPDKEKAASERPVPSQAEGDRETIEEDLERERDPKTSRQS